MGIVRNISWIGVLAVGVCGALPFYRSPSKDATSMTSPNKIASKTNNEILSLTKQQAANFPKVDIERSLAGANSMLEPPRLKLEPTPAQPPLVSLPDWANPTSAPPALDAPPPIFTPVFVRKQQPSSPQAPIEEPQATMRPIIGEIKPTLPRVRRHRLVDGDSMRLLALRYYGDEQRASEIIAANQGVLGNPELLPIGQEIVIPAP